MYYVAGGAVRDLLLGRTVRDADYVFDVTEDIFLQRNPSARKTQSGKTAIYLLDGQEFTFIGDGNGQETAITCNLLARDFTINALLLSEDGILHAHPLGLPDLRDRLIRPASASALADDPLRAFRAARFASDLPGFSLHEDCLAQMQALAPSGLCSIAAEQAGKELLKACLGYMPGNFLRILHQGGCLSPWFAVLAEAYNIPAGPPAHHGASLLEHTAVVMDNTAQQFDPGLTDAKQRSLAVWMALCHDLGKATTPADMLPRHLGHETRGEILARALGEQLRLPRFFIKSGMLAARLHMKAGRYSCLRSATKVDLLTALHHARILAPFMRMTAADTGNEALPGLAQRDLETILDVRLAPQWRNMGAASGTRLRELRIMALKNSR